MQADYITKIAAISNAFWKHNSNITQYSINAIRTPKLPPPYC